jgi:hypothetical protein
MTRRKSIKSETNEARSESLQTLVTKEEYAAILRRKLQAAAARGRDLTMSDLLREVLQHWLTSDWSPAKPK